MAALSAKTSKHATLSAPDTVDVVTLSTRWPGVEVGNRTTTQDPLFVTVGRKSSAPADPTLNGDDSTIVMPGEFTVIAVPAEVPIDNVSADTIVKLRCASAAPFSVEGVLA